MSALSWRQVAHMLSKGSPDGGRPAPPAAGQPASRAFSSFEPQACPPQEDFVARPQPFAAPVPRRNLDEPSVAQHARAELASLVADAVFARIQADVRVPPRHRGIGFVAALFQAPPV